MGTMVQEPRENLTNFYCGYFIFVNPADAEMELISRTVGADRVVNESNMTMTHDREIDYLLPGIPPTGKRLKISFTAIESVLRLLGILSEYLPYPHPLSGEESAGRIEVRVPVASAERAEKMRKKNAVASNGLFEGEVAGCT
ncbi:hypothetical protein BDW75DRAFT_230015 [Aspergillus navahoensis]